MLENISSTKWHSIPAKKIADFLNTNLLKGLSESEAKRRQGVSGKNTISEAKKISNFKIILTQFKSPLVYILIFAGFITIALKENSDAIVIFATVFLNAAIGYFQEKKTSDTLSALKKIIKKEARVIRDGNRKIINTENLVIGDIILLSPGDRVPADARIAAIHDLAVNEMALTGEWFPIAKEIAVLPEKTPMADRKNMVYMGTTVESGGGTAIVTAIGPDTEMGNIARMTSDVKEEFTPYQKQIAYFSKVVGIVVCIIAFGIFIDGLLAGFDFEEIFTTAVAVAVAAVPEGLLVAITVILAVGMERILRKKGLVRNLSSAETLGITSVICTDKTGTLTEGKMKVKKVVLPEEVFTKVKSAKENRFLSLKIASLTSGAFIENPQEAKEKWILRGTPTERAFLEALHNEEFDDYQHQEGLAERVRIDEMLFSPISKFSAVLYKESNGEHNLYLCGAPEKVFDLIRFFRKGEKQFSLSEKHKEKLKQEVAILAGKGLRVVAVAYRNVSSKNELLASAPEVKECLKNLIFTGFIAIEDPVRKDVKEVIKKCQQMGIRTIIATGDHQLTARTVAKAVGLGKLDDTAILEGRDLDELSDSQLNDILEDIVVYARVEPKHKMRIIQAWKQRGEVVAMTGDGINDAPALRQADIGVALGSGTEAAKEASDLVLLNDSFSIIVAAVEEGRAILDNIRKVITYLLSDSFTEVILIGTSIVFGLPLPVSAAQILWVNLIEDSFPSFALAFEPKETDVAERKPPKRNAPLITGEMKVLILAIGLVTDFLLLGIFLFLRRYSHYNLDHIRTIIFVCLAFDSLFYVLSCRSLRKNIWQIKLFSNPAMIFTLIFGICMLVAAVYIPFLQQLLKTTPLSFFDWQIALALGLMNIVFIETAKHYFVARNHSHAHK
ncbi:MAG: HAD-IC family P-type ATPase [bacterium]